MRPDSEQAIVRACIDLLTLRGCLVWRQNSGAIRATYKGKERFVRFASEPGLSDIVGVLPGGVFLAVECKRPGKVPTAVQAAFLDRVPAKGGIALYVSSVSQLEDALAGLLE